MTQFAYTGLPPADGDGPNLGHSSNLASDQVFVGRTSASASGRALVPTTLVSTSLVSTSPVSTSPASPREAIAMSRRPPAAFLAQLIATALKAPQTRARRRAEPADARAVYTAAVAGCSDAGRAFSRSL